MKTVSVHIVTYNSAAHIEQCLISVFGQNYPISHIVVVENASQDNTLDLLLNWSDKIHIIKNDVNNGFSGGHNQAIRVTRSDYCLILNPDVILDSGYIHYLVQAIQSHATAGSAVGKLLFKSMQSQIDSAGIIINKARRAFERGAYKPSDFYMQCDEVFGVSGAAALYSRAMIEDISIDGEFFDEDFFAYKEDVDIAWRAQLLGWKSYFQPIAFGYHERGWKTGTRSTIPINVRRLSYINRYKMIVKNDQLLGILKHSVHLLMYECLSMVYILVREPTLLQAWKDFYKQLPLLLKKRKMIQQKGRVSRKDIYKWFR